MAARPGGIWRWRKAALAIAAQIESSWRSSRRWRRSGGETVTISISEASGEWRLNISWRRCGALAAMAAWHAAVASRWHRCCRHGAAASLALNASALAWRSWRRALRCASALATLARRKQRSKYQPMAWRRRCISCWRQLAAALAAAHRRRFS